MDETRDGGAPAEKDQFDSTGAWFAFEHKLRALLEQMGPEERIVIELPGWRRTTVPARVMVTCRNGLDLRVLYGHKVTTTTTDGAMALAREVVAHLRDTCGVAMPQLLAYRAKGPDGPTSVDLGIQKAEVVPHDNPKPVVRRAPLARLAKDREALIPLVAATLNEKLEAEVPRDDDGDFVIEHLGQKVYIRVREDQPAIEIYARVAHDVRSRRQAAVELVLLNRDNCWAVWHLVERSVFQRIMIPAAPYAPTHLKAMLDCFCQAMTETRDDLALRCAGKVA